MDYEKERLRMTGEVTKTSLSVAQTFDKAIHETTQVTIWKISRNYNLI